MSLDLSHNTLNEVGIQSLSWPARSSNLNPIDHIWNNLKRCLWARVPLPITLGVLKSAEWHNIPQEVLDGLPNVL